MEDDQIKPMVAINKELNLQFVLGYSPLGAAMRTGREAKSEFDESLAVGEAPATVARRLNSLVVESLAEAGLPVFEDDQAAGSPSQDAGESTST